MNHLSSPALLLAALLASPMLAQDGPKVAGTDVPAPKCIKMVKPEYPKEAVSGGIRGIVILELTINEQGRVAHADIVRSIAGLDEAALDAVRKWEYEITRVEGKPVSVRLMVPITFALKLPEVKREDGIPELRQGATPAYPTDSKSGGAAAAELTVDSTGEVVEARITRGDSPWSEALVQAARTWRFAGEDDRVPLTFQVQADFQPVSHGESAKVALAFTDLKRAEPTQTAQAPAPVPTPETPAPTAAPGPQATTPGPSAPGVVPSPEPVANTPAPGSPPAPTKPTAPATTAPVAARTGSSEPRQPPPPVEVLSAPTPAPRADAASTPTEPGVSAVRDITLSVGVPDLVKGRRPAVPPLARMAGATDGGVEVRFAVDAAGGVSVTAAVGPDLLKPAAEQAASSWTFRRTSTERLRLVAEFRYRGDSATVVVRPEQ